MNPFRIQRYEPELHGNDFVELYHNPNNREFFRRFPVGWTTQDILRFEDQSQGQLYAVIEIETNTIIGFGYFGSFCNYGLHCQSGVILKDKYKAYKIRDKNCSYYATVALFNMLFKTTPIRKIKWKFLASRKDIEHVCLSYGFCNRTEFKDDCIFDGKYVDELEYSIYRDYFLETYED